ncbi:hypothetical protein ABZ820_23650 [Streptomyces diacarni]|uniref:hypothetical protein n=1 Tax=Streptomyces diacarni TaxID=2800381 RepID=UPI0033C5682B
MSHSPISAPHFVTPAGPTEPGFRPDAPVNRPLLLVFMFSAAALSALSGILSALMVYLGGKDLADQNVRNAVDSDPAAVGLPADTRSADLQRMSPTAWDDVVTHWQDTMSARAAFAAALAVLVLVCALLARNASLWSRAALSVAVLLGGAFPHVLVLRDAPPTGLYVTSLAAPALAVVTVVLCWLPTVGRYAKARGRS